MVCLQRNSTVRHTVNSPYAVRTTARTVHPYEHGVHTYGTAETNDLQSYLPDALQEFFDLLHFWLGVR